MKEKNRVILCTVMILFCFILSFLDFLLTITLLETKMFRELNAFAYPTFFLVPILLAFRKDKFGFYGVSFLSLLLLTVVIHNSINLIEYIKLVN